MASRDAGEQERLFKRSKLPAPSVDAIRTACEMMRANGAATFASKREQRYAALLLAQQLDATAR